MQPTRPWTAAMLAAVLALPVFAANSVTPHPDHDKIQAKMQEAAARLQLTDAQKEQLRPIVEDHVAKVRAIRDKYPPEPARQDKRAMFDEMRGVREDYDAKVRTILTPEQQKEWDKMRDEARERMRQERRQRQASPGGTGTR